MKVSILLIIGLLFLACETQRLPSVSSSGPTGFVIDLGSAASPNPLPGAVIQGKSCSFTQETVGGLNALRLTTNSEFSDGFIHVEQLFGHSLNLKDARFLSMRLFVPRESWIAALKINLRDAAGNFGGIPEVANNFAENYDQWFDVVINLKDYQDRFRIWDGDKQADVLSTVTSLTLNPYCAHQEDASSIYLNRIELSDQRPDGDFVEALQTRPPKVDNVPYHFDFDDDEELRRQTAYRTYEASNQAFAKGIGGNETRAIRMRGREELNNIAFLPIISAVTGQPADFTQVEEIYFDYYLEPGYDEFDGSTLYLTSEHWGDILMDTTFYAGFEPGAWQTVTVNMKDLDLHVARGDADKVLSAVHELRLNLNYREGRKNIVMWIDNFGWR